jgi:tetratricopeptide (TPR) repeat protein
MRNRATISMVAAVVLFSAPVGAEDAKQAKEHFERGTTAYDLQRYAEAAREYELAYEAKNDPALLFNIGQAYRFAGDYAKAIGAFKSYLRRVPKLSNRAEVEAAPTAPPASTPPSPAATKRSRAPSAARLRSSKPPTTLTPALAAVASPTSKRAETTSARAVRSARFAATIASTTTTAARRARA